MALKDRTRRLFAETLIGLMETKSLQEIRVKDRCEKSGADRDTFYLEFPGMISNYIDVFHDKNGSNP